MESNVFSWYWCLESFFILSEFVRRKFYNCFIMLVSSDTKIIDSHLVTNQPDVKAELSVICYPECFYSYQTWAILIQE